MEAYNDTTGRRLQPLFSLKRTILSENKSYIVSLLQGRIVNFCHSKYFKEAAKVHNLHLDRAKTIWWLMNAEGNSGDRGLPHSRRFFHDTIQFLRDRFFGLRRASGNLGDQVKEG